MDSADESHELSEDGDVAMSWVSVEEVEMGAESVEDVEMGAGM